MTGILESVLRHRLSVGIGAVALTVLGVFAWLHLSVDAFPDVTNEQVMILTEAEGLGPLDVEQQITFPLEWVMGGLPDVKSVRSLSKTGLSQVVVIFEEGVDTYFARQLVFERLQLAKDQLPPGVDPAMGPLSTGLGEILQYTIESKTHSLTELRTLQDWLVAPRLRMLKGVNEVNSFGGRVRQVHVTVDPDKLLKYDLTLSDITTSLADNNANAGGGFIVKDWEQENLRNVGLFSSVQDIRDVVVHAEDGTPVYLTDVAEIEEGAMTRMGAVSRDGKGEEAAGMVIMLKGENSKDVAARVKAALPSIESALPKGASINVFYDRTDLVEAVIGTVTNALLQGAIFVVAILFLLIGNFRAALVTALSLPFTALFAFILMDLGDVTANLMSLGGLAVAIGMVVDGSIVVTENIMRHLQERPAKNRLDVVVRAVREVARPIVFSIFIIILVFVPLLTLEDMEGRMFRPLALTMVFAMAGSTAAAMFLVPAILSYIAPRKPGNGESRLYLVFQRGYLRMLQAVLARRKTTVFAALLLLIATAAAVPRIGTEFLPVLEEGAVAINIVRLPNGGLDGSVAVGTFIEKELRSFPEVKTVVTKTGRAEISEDPMGPEQSDVLIMLHKESAWTSGRTKASLVRDMQARLARIPGLRISFSQPIALRVNELISGVKSDLAVKIFGEDLAILKETADKVAAALNGIEGAADVRVEQAAGFSQLDIIPNRRAMARYKLDMRALNEVIETAVGGKIATQLIDGRMRFGVQVRFPEDRRNSIAAVEGILLPTPSGARVPLRAVAEVLRREGPAQISRENNMRRVVVEANVRDRDLGSFADEVQIRTAAITRNLPPGYWVEYGGTFENQQRAMTRLGIIVPLSILLIFVMLISALGSVKAALLVLVNLPFALVGGVAALLLLHINLNVPATVGFIALFGTAVQNGTVLVTFINQLRAEGLRVEEAVLTACRLRFRALLMTAATTVLGLIPMIYAVGPGAEVQRPLAAVVIGGLLTATLLTLFVLPSLYRMVMRDTPVPAAAASAPPVC